MKNNFIHVVVESVVEITKHRDRELIEQSLVKTFYDLIPCRKVNLLTLLKHDPVELGLSIHMDASGLRRCLPTDAFDLSEETYAAIAECLATREPVIRRDAKSDGLNIIYPLLSPDDACSGFLVIHATEEPAGMLRLAQGLMKIYMNYLSLLDENQRDKLTSLLNRKTFDEQLMKIISQADSRQDSDLSNEFRKRLPEEGYTHWLAILDIDHFKRINDTFGHLFGDEVLLTFSQLMKSAFRKDDSLFRFGGEEFIVVLRVPSEVEAMSAFERFRRRIESATFPQVGQVTVSIGSTRIFSDEVPIVILGRADQALYYAKENGRNMVCNYESLITNGALHDNAPGKSDVDFF